ncbi:hypothetical protein HaLaN_11034 [Haematococcus lacustris]|uniref:Uncharacterized protein n=1 Tax=Haematococcus lacustris TaxID=44745 RepID=A0A699Z6K5_HAELA|nr:hypothetical protein HaLaN_11034 [Haematococcus lacustris]
MGLTLLTFEVVPFDSHVSSASFRASYANANAKNPEARFLKQELAGSGWVTIATRLHFGIQVLCWRSPGYNSGSADWACAACQPAGTTGGSLRACHRARGGGSNS